MSQNPEQGQQPDRENDTSVTGEQAPGQPLCKPVGEMLREAREKKNLTIEKVAASLYFTPSRVRAIECGDYAQIPAKAYALGYVRAYAKLLGMPTDELITAFNRITFWDNEKKDKIKPRPALSVITRENASAGHSKKWFIMGIGILVMVLALLWWKGNHHTHNEPLKTLTNESSLPVQPMALINQANMETASK